MKTSIRKVEINKELQSVMFLDEEEPIPLSSFGIPKTRSFHELPASIPMKVAKPKPKTPAQVARIRRNQGWTWVDNLQYRTPEPLPIHGTCGQNGECTYTYHTGSDGLDLFLKYLRWIVKTKAVFALDFETGPAKTAPVSDVTGEMDLSRLSYSTESKRRGSEPHTSVVFLASISVKPHESHVIDVREMRQERGKEFAKLLAEACTVGRMIAHNAVFESVFVRELTGVYPLVYSDTMIKTRIAYAGQVGDMHEWKDARKVPVFTATEEDCLKRELQVFPDKELQTFFLELHPQSGLTKEMIAYVAGDTAYLSLLNDKLDHHLETQGLTHIWETIERPFMPLIAKAYYEGVRVDTPLMIEYRDEANAELEILIPQWEKMNVRYPLLNAAGKITGWEKVNYESGQDTLAYFSHKYPGAPITNRKGEASVDEDVLKDLIENRGDTVAPILLELRTVIRVLSTYLIPWIRTHRNPVTGNIHCTFGQCDTSTGRMNSHTPNLQNLPSKSKWNKIRHCFISGEGRSLVDRDLSQFEVRALADMAGEKAMIDFFDRAWAVEKKIRNLWLENPQFGIMCKETRTNCTDERIQGLLSDKKKLDFHILNAVALFKTKFTEATPEAQDLMRKQGKSLTFGIPYGVSESKVSVDFGIPLEDAASLIGTYYATWTFIARYLNNQKYDAREKRVSLSPTGRKRFYCRRIPSPFTEKEVKMILRSYERKGQNFSVQCVNGDVLKVASIMMQPFLIAHGARIVLWVHDEILVECPNEHIQAVSEEMERCMKEAGPLCGLHTCPIETEAEISPYWNH